MSIRDFHRDTFIDLAVGSVNVRVLVVVVVVSAVVVVVVALVFGLFVLDCLRVHAKHACECLCVDVCWDCSDGGVVR